MDNVYVIIDGELYHHGIKGMKWGRRRYQNEDGSLTAAGKKRYSEGGGVFSRWKKDREAQAKAKADAEARRPQTKKSVKDMTDEELATAIRRSQMEQQYRQLNPEQVSAGKAFVNKFVSDAIVPAAVNAGRNFLEKSLNKFTGKMLGDNAVVDELSELKREFDILDYKNKISKLKNPSEDISETVDRLRRERELDELTDDEYQQLKKDAQKSKWRDTINGKGKGKDKKDRDTDDDTDDDADDDSDEDGESMDSIRASTTTTIGKDFVSNLLGKTSSYQERRQALADKAGVSPSVVSQVRAMTKKGMSAQEISDKYGIDKNIVLQIRNPNGPR